MWRVVAVLVLLSLMTAGCGRAVGGTPSPGATSAPQRQQYEHPDTGRGFSVEPLDQPNPMPHFAWRGWQQRCAWIPPDLLAQFGASAAPVSGPFGCVIPLGGNEVVEIAWIGAYKADPAPMHFVRETEIAGLQAREFARAAQGERECGLQVNTRSTVTLGMSVWDHVSRTTGDRETRCQVARRLAEIVLRRLVPLAGGAPWPGTPQRPDPAVLDGGSPCQMVDQIATHAGNLGEAAGTSRRVPQGSVCEFTSGHGATAQVLLARELPGGLGDLEPVVASADVSSRKLAGLPARLEDAGDDCGLAAELAEGTVLHVRYFFDEEVGGGLACKFAEVVAAYVLVNLLNKTGG